jgi:pimeloyl-ACP methyl ester carboxylesterase
LTHPYPTYKGPLAVVQKRISDEVPTLIFLHDSLGCIQTWRDFPALLAQKTNCNYLIYDRLGYGQSPADPEALNRKKDYLEQEAVTLNRLIEELEIQSPILFGHSDGGSIALIAASLEHHRISAIIAEAAHIFVEEITLAGIRRAKENYPHGGLREKLMNYHGSKADAVFYAWADTWLADHFRDWNIEPVLSSIHCPCLIIQGEKDEFGSLRQVEGIERNIRGKTRKIIVKNAGHSPHKERKELILKRSSEFINLLKSK